MNTHKKRNQTALKYVEPSLSDEEFLACAVELGHRLSRHLDAVECAAPGAVADVASVLRTLVVRGDGDDVIRRLCKRFHVALPDILVARAAHDDQRAILSAGAMPVTADDAEKPHQVKIHLVNLNQWTDMTALVVRDGIPHRVNTWNRVIALYANTFGSHLRGTIPQTLATTSSIMSGRLDLGAYMVHCAGLVTESSLNQVLDSIAGKPITVAHKYGRQLNAVSHLTLWDDDGEGEAVDLALMAQHLPDVPIGDEIDVLRLHFADRYMKTSYQRRADGKFDGRVRFSDQKPDWWLV